MSPGKGCQQMLHEVMAVTVAVMIVPLHTRYPPVVGVAWATELPLHHPSWRQVPPKEKARVMARIGTQFDMRPHMEYDRWPLIYAAIQQHLQKIYNGKKAALKEKHWIPDSDGTYNMERIRQSRPSHISEMESSATREYSSLIYTFFLTHTVNGVFLNPEEKFLYDELLRLQGLGSNTETILCLFGF
ncbi:hypothetical protein Tco_1547504 [Tanacetum coccineum]